jgi:heme-degrading monooxygenase HmoA
VTPVTKHLVSFATTLLDERLMPTHLDMVRRMRELAEQIDGFVEWRDSYDGLDYWGFVVFASPEAALSWKANPTHGQIHQEGEAAVYSAFSTQVFELVREASWRRDEVGAEPHG